jgi:hypothetical protein
MSGSLEPLMEKKLANRFFLKTFRAQTIFRVENMYLNAHAIQSMPYGNSHTGFNARSFSIKWLDEF